MNKNYLIIIVVLIVFLVIVFVAGGQIGWNRGYEEGLKEAKTAIEKSMELYNLGEAKYILLARETAGGKEANPEFVQKMWDIKERQDELLKGVVEFAKKLGIDTNLRQVPLAE